MDLFGIGSIFGSLLNGMFASDNVRATNEQNYQIAMLNNEYARQMFNQGNVFNRQERLETQAFNEQMMREQMRYNTSEREAAQDYNTQMWLKSAEYNSAVAQAQRLRQAGINPSNVLNGAGSVAPVQSSPASASPASSSPASSMSAPSLSTPTMMPTYDGRLIGDTLNSVASALKTKEEVKGMQIDNEIKGFKNREELEKLIADKMNVLENTKLTRAERERLRYEITGLKIQNARNEFAMKHDQIVEDRTASLFDKTMRQMDDAHNESMLRQVSQHLVNVLSVRKDAREVRELNSALSVARASIEKMAAEKGYINKQAATEEVHKRLVEAQERTENQRMRLTQNQADMSDVDRRSKNMDYERKVESFSRVLKTSEAKEIDNFLYYLGETLGVPLKGFMPK